MTLEGKLIQKEGQNRHHCAPHNNLLPMTMVTFQYENMLFQNKFYISRMKSPFPWLIHFYKYYLHTILIENCQFSLGLDSSLDT